MHYGLQGHKKKKKGTQTNTRTHRVTISFLELLIAAKKGSYLNSVWLYWLIFGHIGHTLIEQQQEGLRSNKLGQCDMF